MIYKNRINKVAVSAYSLSELKGHSLWINNRYISVGLGEYGETGDGKVLVQVSNTRSYHDSDSYLVNTGSGLFIMSKDKFNQIYEETPYDV